MQLLNYNNSFNRYNNISFQMKKSEFDGIDRKVVEDAKAPVEKFNVKTDFYSYCSDLNNKIKGTDFEGRRKETQVQRQSMLQEWFDYVLKENDAYTPSISYMILNGITKDLKPNEDTLPPVLNKGVLAQTVEDAQNKVIKDKNLQFNFSKMYKINLQKKFLSKEEDTNSNLNGWIIIPSKRQDSKNFNENVEKLKMLSHDSWCTKSFNAEPYLKKGEFHVYMENGKPKLGVRFIGNKIQEIQGPKNDSKIPLTYSDVATEHIKKYKLTDNASREINILKNTKEEIAEYIRNNFPNGIENATTQELLETIGIKCKKDTDGLLVISHYYGKLGEDFTLGDIGVNENKLFKEIKEIKADADFSDSHVTSLGRLQSIGGDADFRTSQVVSLGNLQTIGGDADFNNSQVTSLGNLKTICGYVDFEGSKVTSLGDLQTIGENVYFNNSQVKSLDNLQTVGKNAYFNYSKIESLGNLQEIGGNADFDYSQIVSLGNLKIIGGNAYFSNSSVISLDNLQTIGGNAIFSGSKVTSLGDLKTIGRKADFSDSQLKSLGNLQSIGGDAIFVDSEVTSLDNLQTIGGNADFGDSEITSLGNLKIIGGNANFSYSKVVSLGDLQKIEGNLYIDNFLLKLSDFDGIYKKI